jgi:xanthine dehydrogenase small subunit
MAAKTSLAEHTGKFLKGKRWSKEIIDEACVYLDKDFSPISDARASVEGRKIMSRNLLWKLWTDTNAIQ